MGKKIIHYKVFNNDDELVEFQENNEIIIISISLFTNSLKIEMEDKDSTDASGKVSVGVYLLFRYAESKG